jgi:hypothetical protein
MRPTPSMAQRSERRLGEGTRVPAMPRTAPRVRPVRVRIFMGFFIQNILTFGGEGEPAVGCGRRGSSGGRRRGGGRGALCRRG